MLGAGKGPGTDAGMYGLLCFPKIMSRVLFFVFQWGGEMKSKATGISTTLPSTLLLAYGQPLNKL